MSLGVRQKRLFAIVALVAASVVVSLAVAEVVLRQRVPEWSVIIPPTNFRPDLFEAAPFGYRLKPGVSSPYRYSPTRGEPTAIVANAEGFRGKRNIGDGDERPRIAVVGDSMVFGIGVEESARFTELLEEQHPGWRVDNLGMVGFGPDLMLRALEDVALARDPRVVVVVIHSDDLRRVSASYTGMGFALPKYVLDDGALVSQPFPEPRPWDRLLLFQGLRFASWRYSKAAFSLNEAILDRFHALAREHGYRLVIAYVPPPREAWHDRMRRDFLSDWASASGVAFVDLSPPPADAGSAYLPGDSHWSVAGHEMVARTLAPMIERALGAGDPRR